MRASPWKSGPSGPRKSREISAGFSPHGRSSLAPSKGRKEQFLSNLLEVRPRFARCPARCWNIALERVVHHHAIGIEPPAQGTNRPLHAFDPAPRQPVAIAMVVERNHLFAQHAHQVFAIARS